MLLEIARVAVEDLAIRKKKHLPSDYDKAFSPRIFENELIQALYKHKGFRQKVQKLNLSDRVDKDYFKKMYSKFSKEDSYIKYFMDGGMSDLDILLEMYRFCRADEFFNEIMEDSFFNWQDDKSLVIGAIKKCFKASPNLSENYFEEFYPDDETVRSYGEYLLERTFEDDKMLLGIVKPLLKNWDHERLALIDTILIKMAIVELLNCETIPTKVTINEYVEVSKMYSTPKSKDFINGILDKVLKDLTEQGKIVKKGRGLIE
jgi:N utilization substance protein B